MNRAVRQVCTAWALVGLSACSLWEPTPSMLRGLPPIQSGNVAGPERLTDGFGATEGSAWNGPTSVTFGADGFVVFDLGVERHIAGAALQGDNNDTYELAVSNDAMSFSPVWVAEKTSLPGMQKRVITSLNANGRYLRIRPVEGDNAYSLSELEVYADSPTRPFAAVKTPSGESADSPVDTAWTQWAIVCACVLFLTTRRSAPVFQVVGSVLVVGAAWHAWNITNEAWVLRGQPISWVRAMAALVMALAMLRELVGLGRRSLAAHRGLVITTSLVAAIVGAACFVNLGHAQFVDSGKGQPTFLHHYDMRHYFPIARYFNELRFDGVYAASAQALIDLEYNGDPAPLANFTLRNLRTHEMSNIGAMKDHIAEVRARFTPERWTEFLADARYFRNAMGTGGYLSSMNDHGGNATPVWFMTAALLFRWGPASDFILWAGALLDMLLVAAALLSTVRAFGWRTGLICACVFGAMDFYMFGTNWFGAAFRHDWLALWALGACALKVKRYRLAGALLAWSALIRAFPAVAFFAIFAPEIVNVAIATVKQKRLPNLKACIVEHRALLQIAIGAAVCGGLLLLASTALFGVDAWTEWFRKVSLLNRDGHVNNIALRTWLVTDPLQLKVISVVALAAVALIGRSLTIPQRAVFSVALVPIIFNPANYYLHAMFMMPMLADEVPGRLTKRLQHLIFLTVTLMCVASWQTTLTDDIGVHFRSETVICFVTLGILTALVLLMRSSRLSGAISAPVTPLPPVGSPT